MAISKIQYDTKVAINIDSTIPDINKCNASDLNEIKSVVNNNADEMTNYVKNTDYASSIKSGVIYGEPQNGFMVGPTGKPYTPIMPYSNYSSLPNTYFISKGTLENAITGKGLIDKDVNDLTNYTKTSDLSNVATSGSYNDLIDTPTIPSISDEYGTSTANGYSQNYINTNTLNPSGEPSTSEEDVSSATFTNTLEAPINIDLKGNTEQDGTPTPSSPIPVNVVSGDNDIVVCGKNLFDGVFELGDINTTTGENNSNNSRIRTKNYILIEPETTYTLSTDTQDGRWGVFYDKNKNFLSRISLDITGSNTSKTFTSVANAYYIRWYLLNNTSLNVKEQLQLGSTATTYEAYNGTTYNIDLPVENLFDKDNANITHFYSTATAFNQNNSAITIIIPIQENNNYTISSTNRSLIDTSANVTYTSEIIDSTSDTYLQRTMWASTDNSLTTTAPSGAKYMYVYVKWSTNQTDINNCLATIQIEEGKSNTYTPYGTTPIELCKIGTYQDYFYKENNTWYLHKEIGKVVLDGSETGWDIINNNQFYRNEPSDFYVADTITYFNNYYQTIPQVLNMTNFNTQTANIDYAFAFKNRSDSMGVAFKNKDITDLNTFKTWLSTHNVIIEYVLATPTNTEITYQPLINQLDNLQNAMSKKGTTNINQVNNDLLFILDLSVFNDTYNGRYQSVLEMYKRLSNQ